VSNFDTEFTREQPTLTPVHGQLTAKDQAEFNGFSWVSLSFGHFLYLIDSETFRSSDCPRLGTHPSAPSDTQERAWMKRPLVSYSTDSELEDGTEQVVPPNPVKKRYAVCFKQRVRKIYGLDRKLLPKLPSTLSPIIPQDDPSLHQGRVRSQPFVDGQFASHVYVTIPLSVLGGLINEILESAKQMCKDLELHPLIDLGPSAAHQRDPLKEVIRNIAKSCSKSVLLTNRPVFFLNNEEGTRSFLTLEVGAGHLQLAEVSQSMAPFLQELRQPSYYLHPRYHTSVAWILTLSSDAKQFPKDLPERLESQFA
ncbi:3608_t:CDS:2, partial [Acaulospora colombiana]